MCASTVHDCDDGNLSMAEMLAAQIRDNILTETQVETQCKGLNSINLYLLGDETPFPPPLIKQGFFKDRSIVFRKRVLTKALNAIIIRAYF